ncbi:MAG: DUF2007 domain-containing protein [Pseudomonadota bacterium]
MKRVFASADGLLVGHVNAVLQAEGIQTLVKNEHLSGAVGELPAVECWPEVWVVDPDDHARADYLTGQLVAAAEQAEAAPAEPWQCSVCGELIEPQFTDCWRCDDGSMLA